MFQKVKSIHETQSCQMQYQNMHARYGTKNSRMDQVEFVEETL